MPAIILIHGAWHDARCWHAVKPILEGLGHSVSTPDLPGHGQRQGELWSATLGGYARTAIAAARKAKARPVLVGHSLGGAVITEAAAREPTLFSGLVYLCAFVPQPGESLVTLASRDHDGSVPRSVLRGLWTTGFRQDRAADVFYNRCPDEVAAGAAAAIQRQPNLPTLQRLSRPRGPSPARSYVLCSDDRAISPGHQRWMAERAGIENLLERDWDHSPFLSAPDELARLLSDLAFAQQADPRNSG
ncbi:MAG: alpha/beta fold hydrolase [Novosphingobium sp.]|jgi:pimeloyl-ACP methyl ester carboxylesterase|uniref:alpha/beta fold hydrolase n=1 Tax=Novosphingobium sp. TaxID=1874826 RepID=UPI0039193037|nr:alpha/beta hydrolase [Novosphingobium sp.]